MNVGGPSADLLLRLMNATTMRSRVIASNIANQNTPGFQRQLVNFEQKLESALANGQSLKDVQPEIVGDFESPSRPDGNNVNLEMEMNSMRENRIMYETYSTILAGQFELLRTSIKDGN